MVRKNSKVAQGGLTLLLALTALTGCRGDGSKRFPQDPLFVRKQPMEVQPEAGPPQAVARTELTMPADPLSSLAASRPAPEGSRFLAPGAMANQHPIGAGLPNPPLLSPLSNRFPGQDIPFSSVPSSGANNPLWLP